MFAPLSPLLSPKPSPLDRQINLRFPVNGDRFGRQPSVLTITPVSPDPHALPIDWSGKGRGGKGREALMGGRIEGQEGRALRGGGF